MFIACGSAWRADPRVTHGWCRPRSTHQHALQGPVVGGRTVACAVDHSHYVWDAAR